MAYKIAKRYYKNVHYVWCTTEFNSPKQPPTSNPSKICKKYLEQISTGDRHTKEIKDNIAGILRGAKEKVDSGIISEKVKDRCIEVSVVEKASDNAVEYKIADLKENEFEVIFFKDILDGIMDIVDKKAGE